ncbi:MAG: 3-hydroxyacyl-CoA dehydrogenase [Acidimicrobiaceae bacterium]|jgi:3-hydroxyacyl-CoA dehydrogenase|nr:3-hydroxyacyl-CoA dehydrogenase [Acidimicrobiaceae bacterium]
MGPLALSDFIGLDTLVSIADVLYDEYRDPAFVPPPLLLRIVEDRALRVRELERIPLLRPHVRS